MLFDKESWRGVEDIMVISGGPFFWDLQWRLDLLPIRSRELGMYSAIEASSGDFVALWV